MGTTVKQLTDAALFVANHSRQGEPVGVELSVEDDLYRIAIAGEQEDDYVAWQGELRDPAADVLARALDTNEGLKIVPTSLVDCAEMLEAVTGVGRHVLGNHIVGDVLSLAYTTGVWPEEGGAVETARGALSFWKQGQRASVPAYYRQVAEPLERLALKQEPRGTAFSVQYQDLMLRVIGYYSHEPTFVRSVGMGEPPHLVAWTAFKEQSGAADVATYYAAIIWTAYGYDDDFIAEQFPELWIYLEAEDREELKRAMAKSLPSIVLLPQQAEGSLTGEVRTLYGRRRNYHDATTAMRMDFLLGGTVEDIINVAAVTLANMDCYVNPASLDTGTGAERRYTLRGVMPTDGLHYDGISQQVTSLLNLGEPLSPIYLNPVLTME